MKCPFCNSNRLDNRGLGKNKFGEEAYTKYRCIDCHKGHSRFLETKYGIEKGTIVNLQNSHQ